MEKNAAEVRKFGWDTVALWTLATAATWGVGIVPAILIITAAFLGDGDIRPDGVTIALYVVGCYGSIALAGGVSVGAGQHLVFQAYKPDQANRWLLLTAIGGGIGWVLGWICSYVIATVIGLIASYQSIFIPVDIDKAEAWILSGPIVGMVTGLMMGLTQWRVLQQLGVRSKRWTWVLLSGLSWATGLLAYWVVYDMVGGPFFTVTGILPPPYYSNESNEATSWLLSMFVGWIAGGLVIGSLTGIVLKRLLAAADHIQPLLPDVIGVNSATRN